MKRIAALVLSLYLFVSLTACFSPRVPEYEGEKLNIVTVLFPEYDFVRAVVGDRANISLLVPPGSPSVHAFEPSPSDIITMSRADVFVFTGGESHQWVDRILGSFDTSNMRIVRLIDFVDTVPVEDVDDDGHNHDNDSIDEHIWSSPANAIILVDEIAEILAEVQPENADFFRENADTYIAQLQEVHDEILDVVANSKLDTIVMADKFAFRYFVLEYGLNYAAAFSGCSDQTDPTAKTLALLIETVERLNLPYIFYAELSNHNVARTVSEHTGAEMLLLHSTQTISREDFNADVTYVDIMRRNAESLKRGLVYESNNG